MVLDENGESNQTKVLHQIKASNKEIQNLPTNQKVHEPISQHRKKLRTLNQMGYFFFFSRRRLITTMQKIQIKVEQMSKQAFIEGWNKADPQIVNQIANL